MKQMPTPTTSGLVVFVEADEVAADGAGRLASVSQRRPLHSHRVDHRRGGRPLPLALGAAGRSRARRRGGPPTGRGPSASTGCDPATGAREKAFDDPAWHDVQAKLVAPAPGARRALERRPRGRPGGQALRGRREPPRPGGEAAEGSGEAAAGRRGRAGHRGEAGRLGVFSARSRSPGTAPSRCRCRPTRRCSCSCVDADGLALRSSAWVWVRNHAAQGCVGCHEDPERTPPNRFMQALQAPAPRAQPARGEAPHGELRGRRAAARRVEVPVLPRGRRAGGPGSTGRARSLPWVQAGRGPAQPARLAPARPGDRAAVGPGGRDRRREADARRRGSAHAADVRTFVEWIDLGGQP